MEDIKKSMENIASSLSTVLKSSVCIRLESWHHYPERVHTSFKYQLSIIPGFDEDCTIYYFDTWNGLMSKIKELKGAS